MKCINSIWIEESKYEQLKIFMYVTNFSINYPNPISYSVILISLNVFHCIMWTWHVSIKNGTIIAHSKIHWKFKWCLSYHTMAMEWTDTEPSSVQYLFICFETRLHPADPIACQLNDKINSRSPLSLK